MRFFLLACRACAFFFSITAAPHPSSASPVYLAASQPSVVSESPLLQALKPYLSEDAELSRFELPVRDIHLSGLTEDVVEFLRDESTVAPFLSHPAYLEGCTLDLQPEVLQAIAYLCALYTQQDVRVTCDAHHYNAAHQQEAWYKSLPPVNANPLVIYEIAKTLTAAEHPYAGGARQLLRQCTEVPELVPYVFSACVELCLPAEDSLLKDSFQKLYVQPGVINAPEDLVTSQGQKQVQQCIYQLDKRRFYVDNARECLSDSDFSLSLSENNIKRSLPRSICDLIAYCSNYLGCDINRLVDQAYLLRSCGLSLEQAQGFAWQADNASYHALRSSLEDVLQHDAPGYALRRQQIKGRFLSYVEGYSQDQEPFSKPLQELFLSYLAYELNIPRLSSIDLEGAITPDVRMVYRDVAAAMHIHEMWEGAPEEMWTEETDTAQIQRIAATNIFITGCLVRNEQHAEVLLTEVFKYGLWPDLPGNWETLPNVVKQCYESLIETDSELRQQWDLYLNSSAGLDSIFWTNAMVMWFDTLMCLKWPFLEKDRLALDAALMLKFRDDVIRYMATSQDSGPDAILGNLMSLFGSSHSVTQEASYTLMRIEHEGDSSRNFIQTHKRLQEVRAEAAEHITQATPDGLRLDLVFHTHPLRTADTEGAVAKWQKLWDEIVLEDADRLLAAFDEAEKREILKLNGKKNFQALLKNPGQTVVTYSLRALVHHVHTLWSDDCDDNRERAREIMVHFLLNTYTCDTGLQNGIMGVAGQLSLDSPYAQRPLDQQSDQHFLETVTHQLDATYRTLRRDTLMRMLHESFGVVGADSLQHSLRYCTNALHEELGLGGIDEPVTIDLAGECVPQEILDQSKQELLDRFYETYTPDHVVAHAQSKLNDHLITLPKMSGAAVQSRLIVLLLNPGSDVFDTLVTQDERDDTSYKIRATGTKKILIDLGILAHA